MDPRQNPAPLTARDLWREVVDELFSLDRGLPYTFVSLWRAPGVTVRRYVETRDPKVTRPVRYFLVAAGAMAATVLALRTRLVALGQTPTTGEQAAIANFAIENLLVINAVGVVCGALVLRLIFSKRGTTFGETLVLSAYSGAQAMWLNVAFAALIVVARHPWIAVVGSVAMVAYNLWFWATYFGGRARDWLLAFAAYLLGQGVLGALAYGVTRALGSSP